jgi:hypothetical protein
MILRALPKRNHRREEAEKLDITLLRFVKSFFVVFVGIVFFVPVGSNAIIFLLFFGPLSLTIAWGLISPPKSTYEIAYKKELEERGRRWDLDG